jgi:hypothetical protein
MIDMTISSARYLLVGNFSCGTISAFNPTTGALLGTLDGRDGKQIFIQDLGALTVGNRPPRRQSIGEFDVLVENDDALFVAHDVVAV